MGIFGSDAGVSQSAFDLLEMRVRRLEALVARLSSGGGAGTESEVVPEVSWHADARELIGRGQKIAAIKLVRERTGMGLKEAKDFVERV